MEVFRFNIIPTEEFIKREQFRQLMNNCKTCGNAKEFKYHQIYSMDLLQEEATCPACLTDTESSHHRIH